MPAVHIILLARKVYFSDQGMLGNWLWSNQGHSNAPTNSAACKEVKGGDVLQSLYLQYTEPLLMYSILTYQGPVSSVSELHHKLQDSVLSAKHVESCPNFGPLQLFCA